MRFGRCAAAARSCATSRSRAEPSAARERAWRGAPCVQRLSDSHLGQQAAAEGSGGVKGSATILRFSQRERVHSRTQEGKEESRRGRRVPVKDCICGGATTRASIVDATTALAAVATAVVLDRPVADLRKHNTDIRRRTSKISHHFDTKCLVQRK